MISRVALALLVCMAAVARLHAQSEAKPRLDDLGDPLPEGAIARLGTLRFKHTPATDPTIDVALFSPDGSRIVSLVYNAGSVRLWESATGKEIAGPWSTQNQRVTAVAFSPDSKLLAVASGNIGGPGKKVKDGGVQSDVILYDIAQQKPPATFKIPVAQTGALAFTDGGKTLVTAGDGTVGWWETSTGKEQRLWKPFNDEAQPDKNGGTKTKTFHKCAISPDAVFIALYAGWREENKGGNPNEQQDLEAFGFNLTSGKTTWRVTGKSTPNSPVRARFAFSGDSKRVAVATGTDKVEVRDALNGKLVASPMQAKGLDSNFFGGLSLSSDGRTVALAGGHSQVVIWDTENAAEPRRLTARMAQFWNASTQCLHFSPDDKILLVGADADIQLYDVATLKEVVPYDGHRGWIDFLTFSSDGTRLLTGSADVNMYSQETAVWEIASWKRMNILSLKTPPWSNLGVASPELSTYVGKNGDDSSALFGVADGKLLARFTVPKQAGQVRGFFSPAGKHYLLSAKDENGKPVERLYAVPSGKTLGQLPAAANTQRSMQSERPIAFTLDERLVAVAGEEDSQIHIFETATGKLRHRLGAKIVMPKGGKREQNIHNLAFSNDGRLLASFQSGDSLIHIWDLATGRSILQIAPTDYAGKGKGVPGPPGNRDRVHFAFSPDSRVLAVGQSKIRLWELASLGVRAEFTGHQDGPIRGLAYSPDGRYLASGSADTTILIWNAADTMSPHTLTQEQLEKSWQDLITDNAATGYAAIRALAASPAESVSWIKEHTRPIGAVDPKRLVVLIDQLDDTQFKIRQAAMAELVRMGEQTVPAIDKALAGQPALETSLRLQDIRKRVSGLALNGPRLQAARAIEVLERVGSPDARRVLQALSGGADAAMLTAQARDALGRLK